MPVLTEAGMGLEEVQAGEMRVSPPVPPRERVKVIVPATTANLGPGFDTLGMALGLYNIVEMGFLPEGLELEVEGEGAESLARDEENLVCQAARRLLREVGYPPRGLWIRITNRIPLARGLGSSAAAIVGSLVAANLLSGGKLDQGELLNLATAIEGHPDNVAPALLGGFVISLLEGEKVQYLQIPVPPKLQALAVIPEFHLETRRAREVLPAQVSRADAVFNLSRTAMLVGALATGALRMLPTALHDCLHQPYRAPLVPGMEAVIAAGVAAGAKGVTLSGAGPTLLAFYTEWEKGKAIGEAMQAAFAKAGIQARVLKTPLINYGARVS